MNSSNESSGEVLSSEGRVRSPGGISVSALTKNFGKKQILKDVSFDSPVGSITGLIGPNGAGKTTLLKAIAGLVRPSLGKVSFGGVGLASLRSGILGCALDPFSHDPSRSIKRTLQIVIEMTGAPVSVDSIVESFGLASVADRRYGALSLGMKQRVCLAIALHGSPEYLLLDEPLNGLDVEAMQWLRAQLYQFARDGGTVIISSHLLNELQSIADRFIVLSQGQVKFTGDESARLLPEVEVGTAHIDELVRLLRVNGLDYELQGQGNVKVKAAGADLFKLCVSSGIVLDSLIPRKVSLLDVYDTHAVGEFSMKESRE